VFNGDNLLFVINSLTC